MYKGLFKVVYDRGVQGGENPQQKEGLGKE